LEFEGTVSVSPPALQASARGLRAPSAERAGDQTWNDVGAEFETDQSSFAAERAGLTGKNVRFLPKKADFTIVAD
jgi:hypothetical protein